MTGPARTEPGTVHTTANPVGPPGPVDAEDPADPAGLVGLPGPVGRMDTEDPADPAAPVDPADLDQTRRSLHTVAEHLLAGDLHRATGRIGLRPSPGGFSTPTYDLDGSPREVRVEGAAVSVGPGEWRTAAITSLGEIAGTLGLEVGGPASVYTLQTPADPTRPLPVDAACASLIAEWFGLISAALTAFATRHHELAPTEAQLWPEHFDLALSMGKVNYGGSPGDDEHPLPYLYVGPWKSAPVEAGGFWNETWGARLDWAPDLTTERAVEFFEDGRRRAATFPPPRPSPPRPSPH